MSSRAYHTLFNRTIREDHGVVDRPTVDTPHCPEKPLTEIVDETSPVFVHQEPTASCARHKSSRSALVESPGPCSHGRRRSDATSRPHHYHEPLAGWELTHTAQL